MSEVSGGPGDATAVKMVPNGGSPERTFNGLSLGRMVRALRGGAAGKVKHGSEG